MSNSKRSPIHVMDESSRFVVRSGAIRSGILSLIGKRARAPTREDVEAEQDEAVIERYLKRKMSRLGECKKMKVETGWPDRTCLWKGGLCDFVELKRPKGGRYEPLQRQCHARLRVLGFRVFVLRTKAQVDAYVEGTIRLMIKRGKSREA